MNHRLKPIFRYIEKKDTPNLVIQSDNTLKSKQKSTLKINDEGKNMSSQQNQMPSNQSQQKQGQGVKQVRSTKILKTRQNLLKETTDTFELYDRIAKNPMTVNITYVDKLKNQQDLKTIQIILNKAKKGEIERQMKQNGMTDIIKEEQINQKKRVSMNTRKRFGSLVMNSVTMIQ